MRKKTFTVFNIIFPGEDRESAQFSAVIIKKKRIKKIHITYVQTHSVLTRVTNCLFNCIAVWKSKLAIRLNIQILRQKLQGFKSFT